MEYTVHELAALAGVSTRTLRYYDKLGLLPPLRLAENGYRLYGPQQVADLQQILFYRTLGVELKAIRPLLGADRAARLEALQGQLAALQAEGERIALLTSTLQKTILEWKGEYAMTDTERFEGFKRELIEKNEQTYGGEARARYGGAAVEAANAKLAGMTEEDWQNAQALGSELNALLGELAPAADPAGAEAARLVDLHRRWLCCYWPEGQYSAAAHRGMARLYAADRRFAAYYDAVVPGGCAFLCAAIAAHCGG